jgi:hypothetical protein
MTIEPARIRRLRGAVSPLVLVEGGGSVGLLVPGRPVVSGRAHARQKQGN